MERYFDCLKGVSKSGHVPFDGIEVGMAGMVLSF